MGVAYFSGLIVAAALMGFEYLLIRERRRERCFKAFLFNNWIGAAVFAGIALDFIYFLPLFPGPAIGR
jgi:4-hydroxybenzoate polyprenyltransferase